MNSPSILLPFLPLRIRRWGALGLLALILGGGVLSPPAIAEEPAPAASAPMAAVPAEGSLPKTLPASATATSEAAPEQTDASHATVPFERTRGVEYLATLLFALAILHTFSVKFFAKLAHNYPEGSIQENLYHFLAETEVVFGIWAAALFFGITVFRGSVSAAVSYITSLNYTEPKFVMAVMVVAATRPVVALAEKLISRIAQLMPLKEGLSFYLAALSVGPIFTSRLKPARSASIFRTICANASLTR